MEYALPERIGNPYLLAGRREEFAYLHKWISRIPERIANSHAIMARKKSGKTGIVQRLFNQLWSENGKSSLSPKNIIPFYYEIKDARIWLPHFAISYYRTFASQTISFLEGNPQILRRLLTLDEIRDYGKETKMDLFVQDVNELQKDFKEKSHDLLWETAYTAPHRFAGVYDCSVLVILDEFQNISEYIYRDELCQKAQEKTMAGTFHEHSESKVAPMLVTGSYQGWLSNVINEYLEGGRLQQWELSPYLKPEEGIEAIHRYAEIY